VRIKLEEQIALRNKELEEIKQQVYNHLPTQIRAIEAEIKDLRNTVGEEIKELRNIIITHIIKKSMSEMKDEHDEVA